MASSSQHRAPITGQGPPETCWAVLGNSPHSRVTRCRVASPVSVFRTISLRYACPSWGKVSGKRPPAFQKSRSNCTRVHLAVRRHASCRASVQTAQGRLYGYKYKLVSESTHRTVLQFQQTAAAAAAHA